MGIQNLSYEKYRIRDDGFLLIISYLYLARRLARIYNNLLDREMLAQFLCGAYRFGN